MVVVEVVLRFDCHGCPLSAVSSCRVHYSVSRIEYIFFIDGSVNSSRLTGGGLQQVDLLSAAVCSSVQPKFARRYGSTVCFGETKVGFTCANSCRLSAPNERRNMPCGVVKKW